MDAIDRRRAAARQRGQGRLLILLATGGAALVLLALGGGVLAWRQFDRQKPGRVTPLGQAASAVAGVSAEREGETWNLAQMHAHLRANGVPELLHRAGTGRLQGVLYLAADDDRVPPSVYMRQHPSAQDAHDAAGQYPGAGFSWGRFEFTIGRTPKPEEVTLSSRIRGVLGVS